MAVADFWDDLTDSYFRLNDLAIFFFQAEATTFIPIKISYAPDWGEWRLVSLVDTEQWIGKLMKDIVYYKCYVCLLLNAGPHDVVIPSHCTDIRKAEELKLPY